MNLSEITPLILTFNEQDNLRGALEGLDWAIRIVIIDSISTDDTAMIAAEFPRVHLVRRTFDNHTNQWNFGLDQIATQWVLTLDSDYRCPAEFRDELQEISAVEEVYLASFKYCIDGRPLRSTLYPQRAVLFNPKKCRYVADGHTQLLDTEGMASGTLRTVLYHDDRKPLSRWCAAQVKYARLEADKLTSTPTNQLGWKDRLRKGIVFAPLLTLFYCLILKRLILDGWPGIFYSLQRSFAELLLSLHLIDRKLRS